MLIEQESRQIDPYQTGPNFSPHSDTNLSPDAAMICVPQHIVTRQLLAAGSNHDTVFAHRFILPT
jgi:hypothetical protein